MPKVLFIPSCIGLPTTHDLRGLDSIHLLVVAWGGLGFPDGANFVCGVARDTDIVLPLQNKLNVADLKVRRATQLR